MNDQEVFAVIHDSIQTCEKRARCFRLRAETVRSVELGLVFSSLGDSCQQGARELQNHLRQLGGHPVAPRRRWDAVRRVGLSLRTLCHQNGDLAMLKDCKRGEDRAVSQFRRLLDRELPESLRALFYRQYLSAKCNSVRLADLLVLEQAIGPRAFRLFVNSGRRLRPPQGPGATAL